MRNNNLLKNLIFLAIVFMPLYLMRIKIWIMPTNILEIIIGIIFLIWLFSDKEKNNKIRKILKNKKYAVPTSMIFLGLILSAFFSGNNVQSWGIIKSWFLFPILLVFLAGAVLENKEIKKVFWVYFLSAAGVSIISLGYFLNGQVSYDDRLASVFISPNYLAMYLAPVVIMGLEIIANRKKENGNFKFWPKNSKEIIFLTEFTAILITFYFTYSYAAWMAVLGSFLIVSIIKNKINAKKILVAVIVFAVLFISQLNNKKMVGLLTFDQRSSLASREIIWKASLKMIKNNFWLGIGPGNFQKNYLEYQKFYPPYLEWAVPHPNNLYLACWLYSGILGLVGFLSLIFFFFKNIFERIKKEPTEILFIALGAMLVILIHGILDTTYFKNDLAVIFWLNFLALRQEL
jgi:O-antigen ligase